MSLALATLFASVWRGATDEQKLDWDISWKCTSGEELEDRAHRVPSPCHSPCPQIQKRIIIIIKEISKISSTID